MDPRIVVIEESEHYLVADLTAERFPEKSCNTAMLEFLLDQGLDCIDVQARFEDRHSFKWRHLFTPKFWWVTDAVLKLRITCKKVPPCGF